MWNEIAYTVPNVTRCIVEDWEWIITFIPHVMMDVITYSHWLLKLSPVSKRDHRCRDIFHRIISYLIYSMHHKPIAHCYVPPMTCDWETKNYAADMITSRLISAYVLYSYDGKGCGWVHSVGCWNSMFCLWWHTCSVRLSRIIYFTTLFAHGFRENDAIDGLHCQT